MWGCVSIPIFIFRYNTQITGLDLRFSPFPYVAPGGANFWGYYPGKIWSQLICLFLLIPVKIEGREKLHDKTSYIFVPNHQGSFDIFLIYGFIGRNFKWMMKKSLRKLPFVRKRLMH